MRLRSKLFHIVIFRKRLKCAFIKSCLRSVFTFQFVLQKFIYSILEDRSIDWLYHSLRILLMYVQEELHYILHLIKYHECRWKIMPYIYRRKSTIYLVEWVRYPQKQDTRNLFSNRRYWRAYDNKLKTEKSMNFWLDSKEHCLQSTNKPREKASLKHWYRENVNFSSVDHEKFSTKHGWNHVCLENKQTELLKSRKQQAILHTTNKYNFQLLQYLNSL